MPLDSNNRVAFEFTQRADASLVNTGTLTVGPLTKGGSATFAEHGQIGMGRYIGALHQRTSMSSFVEHWKCAGVAPATGDFTILCLVFMAAVVENTTDRAVWGKNYTGNASTAGGIYLVGGNALPAGFGFRHAGGTTVVSDLNVIAGRYNLLAVTRSGSTVSHHRLYLDSDGVVKGGTSSTTATISGSWDWGDETGEFRVGSDGILPTHNIKVGRCRVDNVARDLTYLTALMQEWANNLIDFARPAVTSETDCPDIEAGAAGATIGNLGSDGGSFTKNVAGATVANVSNSNGNGWKGISVYATAYNTADYRGAGGTGATPTSTTLMLRMTPNFYIGPHFTQYQDFISKSYFNGGWANPYASLHLGAPNTTSQDNPAIAANINKSGTLTQVGSGVFHVGQEMVFTIVVDHANTEARFYIGSKLIGTVSDSGFGYGSNGPLAFACNNSDNAVGCADYYDVRRFPSALTLDEIEAYLVAPDAAPAPTITSVTPDHGPTGTSVSIVGTDFVSGAVVDFDGVAATTVFVDSTHLTATAPAHVDGLVDVTVTNPDTQSDTLTDAFTFISVKTFNWPTTLDFGSADQVFGVDVGTFPDLSPDFAPLTGSAVVLQAVARRFLTARGQLVFHDDYGLDLRGYVNEGLSAGSLSAMRSAIEREAERDERVVSASAQLTYLAATQSVQVVLSIQTGVGPFSLVLDVSSLDVTSPTLLPQSA